MKTHPSSISPAELSSLLSRQGCQLVDVREPVEHAEAHIPDSRLIPLGQLETRAADLDHQLPVVVMCQAGKRGQAALDKLKKLGFADVRNLEGGFHAWQSAGHPCTQSVRSVLPLMRQVQLVIGIFVLAGSLLTRFVHPAWIYLPIFFGAGLIFAGSTGFCGLALLLARMPWNRVNQTSSRHSSCCA